MFPSVFSVVFLLVFLLVFIVSLVLGKYPGALAFICFAFFVFIMVGTAWPNHPPVFVMSTEEASARTVVAPEVDGLKDQFHVN